VGPRRGRPVVFDDTVYFLPCGSAGEAARVASLLGTEPAARFLGSLVFPDAKRPLTSGVLGRLDLAALAGLLGLPRG